VHLSRRLSLSTDDVELIQRSTVNDFDDDDDNDDDEEEEEEEKEEEKEVFSALRAQRILRDTDFIFSQGNLVDINRTKNAV